MNLTDFAYQLLEQQEELVFLRKRNAQLEEEVGKYRESVQQELWNHQDTFGKILTAALDPNSYINKHMRGE
jgi:hypothetical protein